jgi:hypothetical protein
MAGCEKTELVENRISGKKPIYIPISALKDISSELPRAIHLSGTLYLRDSLLFLLEQHEGVHVYNVKDTSNTINVVFLKIPAITDFVVNGTVLYADSWKDLVTIDIRDIYHIYETDRISNVIQPNLYPPLYNGGFECVDETRGAVVSWEDALLENAKCFTN